jgi:ATP-binding cassette, subfamily B, bacterial MsbA
LVNPASSQGGRTHTRILVKRLVGEHIRPHIGLLVLAVSLMAVVAATTAALAFLMETILDDVFTARDRSSLYVAAAIVMAVFLLKGMATYGQNVLVSFVGQRILADLQKRMFAHLLRADLAYFHDQSSGNLISRFINDVEKMRGTVASVLTAIGRDSLTIIFLVGVMFYQDWLLTLASFFAFPTAILPLVNIGKRMRKVSANTQRELGQFTTLLNEVFQGARHVKAYGMEPYERERAGAVIEQIFKLVFRAARTKAAAYPIMETLGGTAIVVVICYGGWQVIEGTRSTGTFFSFVTALLLAYDPVKKLVNLNAQLQEGLAAADRVFEILDVEPAITDDPGAEPVKAIKGDIGFEGVGFSYADGKPALQDVSLQVEAGKTVALVGQSGAGKSTILNLIPRFFDAGSGRITLDGQGIRDITIASLRANIALVSQDVTLFDDTIEANIAYGRAGATPEEIRQAARNASADGFIEAMPDGYGTVVGEHGVKLSGGQRQRVAIARAMLKDAPILLLDEATSALDTESERAVQTALGTLMRGRTTIVIAHRLSTIQSADMIHVVDAGRVVESGRHLELLARDGVYANLHRLQFSDADGAAIARLTQVGG